MRTCKKPRPPFLPSSPSPPPRSTSGRQGGHPARHPGVPRAGAVGGAGEPPVRGSVTGSPLPGRGPAGPRPCPQTRCGRERAQARPGGQGLRRLQKQGGFSRGVCERPRLAGPRCRVRKQRPWRGTPKAGWARCEQGPRGEGGPQDRSQGQAGEQPKHSGPTLDTAHLGRAPQNTCLPPVAL